MSSARATICNHKALALLALIASACGSGESPLQSSRQNEARPASTPPATTPGAASPSANAAQAAPVAAPRDDPGLAGLSPRQRRAYDTGYRDCSAGRYDPDPYPEAYRIGCGAAHDAAGTAQPKG